MAREKSVVRCAYSQDGRQRFFREEKLLRLTNMCRPVPQNRKGESLGHALTASLHMLPNQALNSSACGTSLYSCFASCSRSRARPFAFRRQAWGTPIPVALYRKPRCAAAVARARQCCIRSIFTFSLARKPIPQPGRCCQPFSPVDAH
jgi:hypothetical protein